MAARLARPLYFTLPALEDLSGRSSPAAPPLRGEGGEALRLRPPRGQAPRARHPLLLAPYPNLYRGGEVCLGTSRRGRDLEDWESAFFESAFSHVGDTLASKEGGFRPSGAGPRRRAASRWRSSGEAGRTLKEVLR